MKKSFLFIFLISLVFTLNLGEASAGVTISAENYYPAPAEAGDYFDIILKITNTGDDVTDAVVKFKQSYPFSLDPGGEEEIVINNLGAKSAVTRKFKVRVDAGAKEGDNPLTFQYKDCLGCFFEEKSIPILVMEAQTMFDVVLQEISSEGVYIAIANIGKNPANAVTVRIPEQENFVTKLISASIIGNLESGDYTLVGFQIIPKSESQGIIFRRGENNTEEASNQKELIVQIDYTDPLGGRRSVNEKILLNPNSLSGVSLGAIDNVSMRQQKSGFFSFLKDFWFWISVVLVLIIFRKKIYNKIKRIN